MSITLPWLWRELLWYVTCTATSIVHVNALDSIPPTMYVGIRVYVYVHVFVGPCNDCQSLRWSQH